MRMIIFVIVIGVLTMIGPNSSFGQNNCDNCPGTSWTQASDAVIADALGCTFLVNYEFRTCPGGSREMRITSIEFVPGSSCSGATISMIMNQAIRGVLNNSRQVFNITNPNTPWDVSVITPMCWYKNTTDMEPCSSTPCCSTAYSVVHDVDHYELYDDPVTYSGTTNCNTQSGPGSEVCTDICGSHGIEPEEPLFERYYPAACTSDCEEEWHRDVNNFVNTTLDQCNITVWYDVRDCDPDEYEFQIYKIEASGTCNQSNQAIFQKAIAAALGQLYYIGGSTIVLRQQSCWNTLFTGSKKYFFQCTNFQECCITQYELDINNQIVTIDVSTPLNDPRVECGAYCNNFCGYQLLDNGTPCYKKSDDLGIDEAIHESFINPNPTDGRIKIGIKTVERGSIVIRVFDQIGRESIEFISEINENFFSEEFDCNSLTNGFYYYNIEINGKVLLNGTFILIK
jgi:hypothetical protein